MNKYFSVNCFQLISGSWNGCFDNWIKFYRLFMGKKHCQLLAIAGNPIPFVFWSSIQVRMPLVVIGLWSMRVISPCHHFYPLWQWCFEYRQVLIPAFSFHLFIKYLSFSLHQYSFWLFFSRKWVPNPSTSVHSYCYRFNPSHCYFFSGSWW